MYILRLYIHEDGSVQPASGDADLQSARRHRGEEQLPLLHDPHRGPPEEHDHRRHRQAAGERCTCSVERSPVA